MTQGIKLEDALDFVRCAEELSAIMIRIREYQPNANAYLAMDTLNLMSDNHLKYDRDKYQDFVIASIHMEGFDGGDW